MIQVHKSLTFGTVTIRFLFSVLSMIKVSSSYSDLLNNLKDTHFLLLFKDRETDLGRRKNLHQYFFTIHKTIMTQILLKH